MTNTAKIAMRQAVAADVELLTRLSYTTFWTAFHDHPMNAPEDFEAYISEAFTIERMSREFADPNAVFIIAEIDGAAAGYAKILFGSTEDPVKAERPMEICRLYSAEEFIGKGVGPALMDECLRLAKEHGCDAVWLGVWEYNPRARRFYEKYGFRRIGSHTFQLGSDPQTDDLMQLDLTQTQS